MAARIKLRRNFDSPYDVRVTDYSKPLAPRRTNPQAADGFANRNVSNTTPFVLVGNAPPVRALPRNDRRVGILIQNLDPTTDLRYSFGNGMSENGTGGLLCVPRGSILLDFTTPPDELYLFSTANITVMVMDVTRGF